MACESGDAAIAALAAAIAGPQYIQTDAGSVSQHNVSDLLKAASYLAGTCAGSARRRGIRFNRLVPDGPVQGYCGSRRFRD